MLSLIHTVTNTLRAGMDVASESVAQDQPESGESTVIPQTPVPVEDTPTENESEGKDDICDKIREKVQLFNTGNGRRCRWPCSAGETRSTKKGGYRCRRNVKEQGLCTQHYALAQDILSSEGSKESSQEA